MPGQTPWFLTPASPGDVLAVPVLSGRAPAQCLRLHSAASPCLLSASRFTTTLPISAQPRCPGGRGRLTSRESQEQRHEASAASIASPARAVNPVWRVRCLGQLDRDAPRTRPILVTSAPHPTETPRTSMLVLATAARCSLQLLLPASQRAAYQEWIRT